MARFRPKSVRHGDIVPWVRRNIRIPSSDARPGAIRLTGYQPDILRAYADDGVSQLTLQLPSQSGKTLSVLMMQAFTLVNNPKTMMMCVAREDDAKRFLRDKFLPLRESNPAVRSRVRVSGMSQKAITFDGGSLAFAHSGSDASMRSTSASSVFADEIDVYSVGGADADHPLDVLRQRLVTYGRAGKLVALSTPTDMAGSMIASEYESGSRGEYFSPCSDCGEWQALGEENVVDGLTDSLVCVHCGVQIDERERLAMIREGEWRHEEPANPNRSFHLTQLSSPLVSLERTLADRLRSTKRGWTCQGLALPYEWDEGESVTPDEALGLFAEMPFTRSRKDGATVGVDIQANRIEYTVTLWHLEPGEHPQAHIAEHRAILYDPKDALDFNAAFAELWRRLRGFAPVDCVFADAGYQTSRVWEAVKTAPRWLRNKVFPCQGFDNRRSSSFVGDDFIAQRSDRARGGIWYLLDTFENKNFAAEIVKEGWVSVDRSGVPPDWVEQFTAERVQMVSVGRGQARPAWVNIRARNESWDCFCYSVAARRRAEAEWIKNPKVLVTSADGA